jgi:exodeoxyribonuclease V alpha subunit
MDLRPWRQGHADRERLRHGDLQRRHRYIDDVDPNAGEIVASFDGRSVTYGFSELDKLVPAYAATIHKSQGSEYPAVVIPVLTQHYATLQRNLLYTEKAVAIAVCNASGRRRWSKLRERLGKS